MAAAAPMQQLRAISKLSALDLYSFANFGWLCIFDMYVARAFSVYMIPPIAAASVAMIVIPLPISPLCICAQPGTRARPEKPYFSVSLKSSNLAFFLPFETANNV